VKSIGAACGCAGYYGRYGGVQKSKTKKTLCKIYQHLVSGQAKVCGSDKWGSFERLPKGVINGIIRNTLVSFKVSLDYTFFWMVIHLCLRIGKTFLTFFDDRAFKVVISYGYPIAL